MLQVHVLETNVTANPMTIQAQLLFIDA